jgi:acyl transferase domain-containing protein
LDPLRVQIPESRFKVSDYTNAFDPKSTRTLKAHTGNFISTASSFDHRFFNISPREARSMDPQQRVLLHTTYEALENAGYVPDATPSFRKEGIGCWVGAATRDYVQNLRNEVDVYYSTGKSQFGLISLVTNHQGDCRYAGSIP